MPENKAPKRASQLYGIDSSEFKSRGVFDAVVGVDNLFFVDPLLLKQTATPEFIGALDQFRNYFHEVITLLRADTEKTYKEAVRRLTLKELHGVGIGYGQASDDGSAIGPGLARQMAISAIDLIKIGQTTPEIFEIMGIFEENLGPDRLSDAVIKINEERFYSYSERIADELGIEERVKIRIYPNSYRLPKHPLENKEYVFIPEEILNDLPVANSFGEIYEASAFNSQLRSVFNKLIAPFFSQRPTKGETKKWLMENKKALVGLLEAYTQASPEKYDFVADPAGLNSWLEKGKTLVDLLPIDIPKSVTTIEELDGVVKKIAYSFRTFTEKHKGWRGLYDNSGKKPLHERAACLFFYSTALRYLEEYGVDISPQSDAGSGPVDFKLSSGREKIVVEVKLTSGNVKQGYLKQVRAYQDSEGAQKGYFVVVQNTETSTALTEILELERQENKEKVPHPNIIVVDGTIKEPASKRRVE